MLGRKLTKEEPKKSAKPGRDRWWWADLLEAVFEFGGALLHGVLKLLGYLVELVGVGVRILIGLLDVW